jgi:hypothetical protein
MVYFKVLSQFLPGRNEKNHKTSETKKTSVDIHWAKQHCTPGDRTLHNHCCETSNPTLFGIAFIKLGMNITPMNTVPSLHLSLPCCQQHQDSKCVKFGGRSKTKAI